MAVPDGIFEVGVECRCEIAVAIVEPHRNRSPIRRICDFDHAIGTVIDIGARNRRWLTPMSAVPVGVINRPAPLIRNGIAQNLVPCNEHLSLRPDRDGRKSIGQAVADERLDIAPLARRVVPHRIVDVLSSEDFVEVFDIARCGVGAPHSYRIAVRHERNHRVKLKPLV